MHFPRGCVCLILCSLLEHYVRAAIHVMPCSQNSFRSGSLVSQPLSLADSFCASPFTSFMRWSCWRKLPKRSLSCDVIFPANGFTISSMSLWINCLLPFPSLKLFLDFCKRILIPLNEWNVSRLFFRRSKIAKKCTESFMPYNFDEIIERRTSNSMKWTQYPPDVLPFWVADMDFRTPKPILDTLQATLQHGVLGYEVLRRRTQEIVAARMGHLYGWQVDPDWIVATPGVVSGFNIAARAVCSIGDGVLIQPPVYMMFYGIYKNIGLTQQVVPFRFTEKDNILYPQLDLNEFSAAFHSNDAKTKMFLLCHPHNPTGQVFTREELQGMADICLQNNTIIVSDEIHSELLLNSSK